MSPDDIPLLFHSHTSRRVDREELRAFLAELTRRIEHGHSLADELRILMLHGALHLAGMDHESDSGEMARAESRWRRRLGLPDGLIERSRTRKPTPEKAQR